MLLRNSVLTQHPYLIRRPANSYEWTKFVQALNDAKVDPSAIDPSALSGGIESLSSLPALPNTNYPIGSVVYLSTDGKLYRNVANSWSKAVDGGDITANTITTNAIAAGQITTALLDSGAVTADKIAANAIETDKINAGAVTASKLTVSELSAITADLGDITAGNIVLNEFIRLGQTAFDTGTGFWLGNDSGTAKFSIGDSSGNKMTWDGSLLSIIGQLQFGEIGSFTPSWSGFSSNPTGDCNFIDAGSIAIIYPENNSFSGASNNSGMAFSGLPVSIRPSLSIVLTYGIMLDSTRFPDGHIGRVTVSSGGVVSFAPLTVTVSGSAETVYPNASLTGFSTSSVKGWSGPIIYPKI